MALTVDSDTRTAINALWGGTSTTSSAALIDATNPRDDDATSVDWDVVGAAIENLIGLFAEHGTTYTQTSATIRRYWWLCLYDYQQDAASRAELDALLQRHSGAGSEIASESVAQDDDDDAERPWIFSETKIDSIVRRGAPKGNRQPRGIR